MDDTDARILDTVQADFPLEPRPYAVLGGRLGITEGELFDRLRRMAADGTIRRLGPRFDSRRLGFVSTLAAARVPAADIERAAAAVNAFDEVTHNYQRAGTFNLWFTLVAADRARCEAILAGLRQTLRLGDGDLLDVPAERVYKLNVRFATASAGASVRAKGQDPLAGEGAKRGAAAAVDAGFARRIAAALADGLPMVPEPYAAVAGGLGVSVQKLLAAMRAMAADGRIRSTGAIADQRRLGYAANVMVAWDVADEAADAAGAAFAAADAVSHCYRRPRRPGWPYNVYTMLHASDERAAGALIERMAATAGVRGRAALPTVREFKKTAPKYG